MERAPEKSPHPGTADENLARHICCFIDRCSFRNDPMNSAIINKIAAPAVKRVIGVSGFL